MASFRPSPAEGASPKSVIRTLNIVVLEHARKEGRRILNPGQYEHVKGVIQRLVYFNDPCEMADIHVEQIEDFWELKEKGGLLGKINLRVYFAVLQEAGKLIVLKVYKKDEEGRPPRHVIINVQSRLRSYLGGKTRNDVIYYAADLAL